ncbi:nucleoside-diphosphate-sugar epimerase family protein [Mycena alexandri]|uniref:Nucleoside-diphosphate-sugar epimerase family protein n=1 Tax=Mycena alexandri TaxID=1745969 RepID=A0AAD6WZV7_9AGAR|nr:nucleoside-diphosphate-sugar epimerase family protein [Mycena alexandri]
MADQHSSTKIVLVMLSTGTQGGGVVKALAKANEVLNKDPAPWLILAQTRDPTSAKSKALASLPGIRLLKGVPTDPATLFLSAPGPVYGVFSVQQSYENPKGVEGEVLEAKALAKEAAKHGVKHFVYTEPRASPRGPAPVFESKRKVEEYIARNLPNLPTTILRPTTFMDQLVAGDPTSVFAKITKLIMLTQLKPDTRLQFIAGSDIGGFAALALQNPEQYLGKVIDLAGDGLTPKDLADGWREVFGTEMRPKIMGGETLAWGVRAMRKELRLMFRFFNEVGFNTDIPALRAEYPEVKDWRTFLRTEVPKSAPLY